MTISLFDIQDYVTIIKTYERGCAYSMTEEATFALMGATLDTARVFGKSIADRVDRLNETSFKKSVPVKSLDRSSSETDPQTPTIDNSPESSESSWQKVVTGLGDIGEEIQANLSGSGTENGGFFNSECIPCGDRIKFSGELIDKLVDLSANNSHLLSNMLKRILQDINSIIDALKGLDYLDICELIKFLLEFVCIPDLYRILSMLATLLMDIGAEINSLLTLMLGLIAPLFMPFLTSLIDMLENFLLQIVKPIECIIDALQNMMSKADFSKFINDIYKDSDRFQISLGRKQGDPSVPLNVEHVNQITPFLQRVPFIGQPLPPVQNTSSPVIDRRERALEFNLLPDSLISQKVKEQQAVNDASKKLERLYENGKGIDLSNPEDLERYRSQLKEAKKEYEDAVKNRDFSDIEKLNKKVDSFQQQFKSSIFQITAYLREAVERVTSFLSSLFDEIKKLVGEYLGGNGNFISFGLKKLSILQLVSLITSIIEFIRNGWNCEKGDEAGTVENSVPIRSGFKAYTDANGIPHIVEDDGLFDATQREFINRLGQRFGDFRQTLGSYVEFTGNSNIDPQIVQAVEGLTTPVRIILRCNSTAQVNNREQIDRWISELQQEGAT